MLMYMTSDPSSIQGHAVQSCSLCIKQLHRSQVQVIRLDTCACPLLFCQDLGSEYAREQWALETLSHHFLPLIRYRRQKARSAGHSFDPELSSPIR
jgi:hypothetical protein